MNKKETADRDFDSLRCSSRAFVVGDTIIVNDTEQPCAMLAAVVVEVSEDKASLKWTYLNADKQLRAWDNSWVSSSEATLTEDFGVTVRHEDGMYWFEPVKASTAKYADGKPRQWQDPMQRMHRYRRELFDLLRPF